MSNKLVYGVAVNDANYIVSKYGYVDGKYKVIWRCQYYQRWIKMLERCYASQALNRKPSYKGCAVCDEWLTFSNFKAWMEKQDWEGKCMDKDILFEGNKVYSPETCVFVDQSVNKFLCDRAADRGDYKIGVGLSKNGNKFVARCRNPFSGKLENLGVYDSEGGANKAWMERKYQHAKEIASKQADKRVANALLSRFLLVGVVKA